MLNRDTSDHFDYCQREFRPSDLPSDLASDQRIVLSLAERDVSELVLAIGGNCPLSTGRTVRQDRSVQRDDAGRTGWGGAVRPAAHPKLSAGI